MRIIGQIKDIFPKVSSCIYTEPCYTQTLKCSFIFLTYSFHLRKKIIKITFYLLLTFVNSDVVSNERYDIDT